MYVVFGALWLLLLTVGRFIGRLFGRAVPETEERREVQGGGGDEVRRVHR